MDIIKASKSRSASASAMGYQMQSRYQIFFMLNLELKIYNSNVKKHEIWKSIWQENKEDLEILTDCGIIYVQLKYNQKSQRDSFSVSSGFFKVFDDRQNKKDALYVHYICWDPSLLQNFWKRDPKIIHMYYKLLKHPEKGKINVKTDDNTITKLYNDLIDEKITNDDLSYIKKYKFVKTLELDDVNTKIDDMANKIVEIYIKKCKCERIKNKYTIMLTDMVLKCLSENKSITREDYLKQTSEVFDLEKNGKTLLSKFNNFVHLDKMYDNDVVSLLMAALALDNVYKFFKKECEKIKHIEDKK